MSVTLKEVAGKAGVSVTTVSRILNGDPSLSVSPATRQRVLKAAEKLDYQARRPVRGQSQRLAILQWYYHDQELRDLYYLNLRLQIEQAAQKAGWETTTAFANNWDSIAQNIDQVIAIGKYSETQLKKMQARFANLIVIDYDCLNLGIDCVMPDLAGGVRNAVAYLKKHYSKIGMIAGCERTTDGVKVADQRLAAFQEAVDQGQAGNYVYGNYQAGSGYQAMEKLLRKCPGLSAVIIANDVMAIGALQYLHEQGIKVPEKLAIISCNDTVAAQYAYPPLSAIHVATGQMAQGAIQLLKQRQENPTAAASRLVIGTKLVCRQSTMN